MFVLIVFLFLFLPTLFGVLLFLPAWGRKVPELLIINLFDISVIQKCIHYDDYDETCCYSPRLTKLTEIWIQKSLLLIWET